MAEVQNTWFDASQRYALGEQSRLQWQKQYHMPAKGLPIAITPAELAKVVPQPSAIDIVTGKSIRTSPIRYTLPSTFADSRPREPLSRLGPEERIEVSQATLEQVGIKHPEEKETVMALQAMLTQAQETKQLYYTINAHMLQFIQA